MSPRIRDAAPPACDRAPGTRVLPRGPFGGLAAAVIDQWLLPAPAANPAMLEMYRDRNRLPLRGLEMWAGEFAGKHLTSAVQVLRITGSDALRESLGPFVEELVSLQGDDGYIGPWPDPFSLTNSAPDPKGGTMLTWDTWGHYHVLAGLLLWHEESGDPRALRAARRIADLFCDRYLDGEKRLADTGWSEMNLAPVHGLAVLHRLTGVERYLQLALSIVEQFGAPEAGDYLRLALAGRAFWEMPKPRWESLHPVMGLAELHRVTGRADFREGFERIWWSIRNADRHADGGFSSGEKATGNPYDPAPIETCCTVAWTAMSVEMLKLTADSRVADELELSTYNASCGSFSPTGRWATYNTPVDGTRKASGQDIVFQSRAGSPELNCCSVNAPRALGLVSEWAAVVSRDGEVMVSWLGPASLSVPLAAGGAMELDIEGAYPYDGKVTVRVRKCPSSPVSIAVRVPAWSAATSWRIGDGRWARAEAGSWLKLSRRWKRGETVELRLDMSLHAWRGARECDGLAAVYRGPLLLSWDRRLNTMDPDGVPQLRLGGGVRAAAWKGPRPPALLLAATAADGQRVQLCDFASAGHGGTPYRSWLPVEDAAALRRSPFTPA